MAQLKCFGSGGGDGVQRSREPSEGSSLSGDSLCDLTTNGSISSWTTATQHTGSGGRNLLQPDLDLLDGGSCLNDPSVNWSYRGEGGANLVVSLNDKKKVVRFTKSKYAHKDLDCKVRSIAHYANHVMRPALGHEFVRPLAVGDVSREELLHVRDSIQHLRPKKRWKKDISGRKAIVTHDCVWLTDAYEANTFGDTVSIEIKPKQGWLSVREESQGPVTDLCHRCLRQYAKLDHGQSDEFSEYCPLDLFSGQIHRMKRAMANLYKDPHNRFKMFKNGCWLMAQNFGQKSQVEQELAKWMGLDVDSQVNGDDVINKLSSMVCTALLATNFISGKGDEDQGRGQSIPVTEAMLSTLPASGPDPSAISDGVTANYRSCDPSSSRLPEGCILDKLLRLQKQSEMDEREAQALRDRLLARVKTTAEQLHQVLLWQTNTLYTSPAPLVCGGGEGSTRQTTANVGGGGRCMSPDDEASVASLSTVSDIHLKSRDEFNNQPCLSFSSADFCDVRRLQQFLLSVSAKDVSLLITFRKVENAEKEDELGPLPSINLEGKLYRVMVSVIDLDPKPINRIGRWLKQKDEMLETFKQLQIVPYNSK